MRLGASLVFDLMNHALIAISIGTRFWQYRHHDKNFIRNFSASLLTTGVFRGFFFIVRRARPHHKKDARSSSPRWWLQLYRGLLSFARLRVTTGCSLDCFNAQFLDLFIKCHLASPSVLVEFREQSAFCVVHPDKGQTIDLPKLLAHFDVHLLDRTQSHKTTTYLRFSHSSHS